MAKNRITIDFNPKICLSKNLMQTSQFQPATDPMLQGWKEVATYLGIHLRTAKEWHYKYKLLPFIHDAGHRYARWRIRASGVDE